MHRLQVVDSSLTCCTLPVFSKRFSFNSLLKKLKYPIGNFYLYSKITKNLVKGKTIFISAKIFHLLAVEFQQ